MTPEQRRERKKEGRRIVEERSEALHAAQREAIGEPSIEGLMRVRGNEEWLRRHPERVPAEEAVKRFVVTAASDLGLTSPYVECLSCHDILHSYPERSTQCRCGSLTVTFRATRRSGPPVVAARDDRARTVVLTARS